MHRSQRYARVRQARLAEVQARGPRCFDFSFYADANPDLRSMRPNATWLWAHYVRYGQFEDRTARFTCDD